MIRFPLVIVAVVAAALATCQVHADQSRLNYGVLLYSQQNYEGAGEVFDALPTAEGKLWLARTHLQQGNHRQAVDTATEARADGLDEDRDATARRVQIAAIRLGKLRGAYPELARALGLDGDRPYSLTASVSTAYVTGLLREFDINGNAVRDDDIRLTLTAAGAYRFTERPLQFQPVVGYRLTHRHFLENDGFNQQNHQPFVSFSRRLKQDLSISLRLDHTTSLSGTDLDVFVQQYGGGITAVWRDAPSRLIRAGYVLSYSAFNNSDADDNTANSIFLTRTYQDAGAPDNQTTVGVRLALVSARAQASAHGVASLFASRRFEFLNLAQIAVQGLISRAQFNEDDATDNRRRKDTTLSISLSAERDLPYDLKAFGQASVTRVVSTLDRIDRTSGVVGVGIRRKF